MISKPENSNKNELNTPPIQAITDTNISSMHTSITLTPIRSETTGFQRRGFGKNLGIIVVPEFSDSAIKSMSISPNKIK